MKDEDGNSQGHTKLCIGRDVHAFRRSIIGYVFAIAAVNDKSVCEDSHTEHCVVCKHCSCTPCTVSAYKTDHIWHVQYSSYIHCSCPQLCTSTCTTHPALPTQLPTLLCTHLTNTNHTWQNGARCIARDDVQVLWCHSISTCSLVSYWGCSIPTCTCFYSENFLATSILVTCRWCQLGVCTHYFYHILIQIKPILDQCKKFNFWNLWVDPTLRKQPLINFGLIQFSAIPEWSLSVVLFILWQQRAVKSNCQEK